MGVREIDRFLGIWQMGVGLWPGRASGPDIRADWAPPLTPAQQAELKGTVQHRPEPEQLPELAAPLGICL